MEDAADLTTAEAVIDALGGLTAAGSLIGYTTQAVWQWKAAGKFPPKTYVAFQTVLKDRGLSAPPKLWSMVE